MIIATIAGLAIEPRALVTSHPALRYASSHLPALDPTAHFESDLAPAIARAGTAGEDLTPDNWTGLAIELRPLLAEASRFALAAAGCAARFTSTVFRSAALLLKMMTTTPDYVITAAISCVPGYRICGSARIMPSRGTRLHEPMTGANNSAAIGLVRRLRHSSPTRWRGAWLKPFPAAWIATGDGTAALPRSPPAPASASARAHRGTTLPPTPTARMPIAPVLPLPTTATAAIWL